jgi:hypothetical protein
MVITVTPIVQFFAIFIYLKAHQLAAAQVLALTDAIHL